MPTLEKVLQFRRGMFADSMALIEQKGHDYNRQQQNDGDTLFNLKVAEVLGIVPTAERGILVRLSDKFMRLISLMTPGVEPSVKGESVRDTVRDIHNYADYALLLWEERQERTSRPEVPTPGAGDCVGASDSPEAGVPSDGSYAHTAFGYCLNCNSLHSSKEPCRPASSMSQAPTSAKEQTR